eukprot:1900544-Prymnesium_polylepis.1
METTIDQPPAKTARKAPQQQHAAWNRVAASATQNGSATQAPCEPHRHRTTARASSEHRIPTRARNAKRRRRN